MSEKIKKLFTFLKRSPTAWHASSEMQALLKNEGFEELKEKDNWKLKPKGKYFVLRNDSSLIAFILPEKGIRSTTLLASHIDSPLLRLKPTPEIQKENMTLFGVEVYGGPLYSSWLNRDLGIAGRVVYLDKNKGLKEKLVHIEDSPLVIPQLAIHLDNKVNQKGLILNPQDHLNAIAAIGFNKKGSYLEYLLKKKLAFSKILSHELFLYPLEEPKLIGYNQELFASGRIDNLLSAFAGIQALVRAKKSGSHHLKMAVFWDNEEIGSSTGQGAASPFASHCLERIILSTGEGREDYFKVLANAFGVSIDGAHGLHPNYASATEPNHSPLLGEGIVVKADAQHAYASNAITAGEVVRICEANKLKYQHYVRRTDLRAGASLGPVFETQSGIQLVDIGCAQLSMHSTRELAACSDYTDLITLLEKILVR